METPIEEICGESYQRTFNVDIQYDRFPYSRQLGALFVLGRDPARIGGFLPDHSGGGAASRGGFAAARQRNAAAEPLKIRPRSAAGARGVPQRAGGGARQTGERAQ